jgi:ribosome-interacting GTPase 1
MTGLMRVFGKDEDDRPFIVPRGYSVQELASFIHKELEQRLLGASVWGPSAKFPGQTVGKTHILEDGDRVELVSRKG